MSDINKVVIFEIRVMRHMETDNNCHNFAGCHSATTLTFLGAVFEQLFLPLGDKYFTKVNLSTSQNNSTNLFMPVPF